MLHHIVAGVGVPHLEADPRRGDDLSGFAVLFDNLNQCLKGGVVDEIALGVRVFFDENVEGGHQRRAFLTFCLDNGI